MDLFAFLPLLILLAVGMAIYNFVNQMRAFGTLVQSLVAYQQQMQGLQQYLMHLEQQQLANRPDLQNDVTQRVVEAGKAIPQLNSAERPVAERDMMLLLAMLAQQQRGGRWSNGAHFQGGNVVIPGGPSLIDGKLFIPR